MKRNIRILSSLVALLLCASAVFTSCDVFSVADNEPESEPQSESEGISDSESEAESETKKDTESQKESETQNQEDPNYPKRTVKIPENLDKIKVYGRYIKGGAQITTGWSASGIEFKADCKGDVNVIFYSSSIADYAVYIDGIEQPVLSVSTLKSNYKLNSQPLDAGVHTFRLIKRSNVEAGVSRFETIKLEGSLLTCDGMDRGLIEFVGDSITCGSGLFTGRDNDFDATKAYSYHLANSLGYDWSMVSVSGIGIHKSNDRHGTNMNLQYHKTNYKISDAAYTPVKKADIVVVNLNTNDHNNGATEAEYKATVTEFIGKVRAMHGADVPIVWVCGMMIDASKPVNGWLSDVFAAQGGESAGLYVVTVTKNNDAPYSHPDAEANKIVAGEIRSFLNTKGLI